MPKLYTLTKSERLKSRKQIEQLFKEGERLSLFPFLIYYLVCQVTTHDSAAVTTQFGVGVSSKNFKRAVDRNRIKRLIRESYRLHKPSFSDMVKANNHRLDMFFIYTGKEFPDYKFVYDKVAIALQKISRDIEKRSAK